MYIIILKKTNTHIIAHYQSLDSIKMIGVQNANGIGIQMNLIHDENIGFGVGFHGNLDYKGTYSIKSFSNQQGVADAGFSYAKTRGGFTLMPADFYDAQGQFTISKYDSNNKIFSGSFKITYTNVPNPLLSTADAVADQNDIADIIISGEFVNVKLVN